MVGWGEVGIDDGLYHSRVCCHNWQVGGNDGTAYIAASQVYDIVCDTWKPIANSPLSARVHVYGTKVGMLALCFWGVRCIVMMVFRQRSGHARQHCAGVCVGLQ